MPRKVIEMRQIARKTAAVVAFIAIANCFAASCFAAEPIDWAKDIDQARLKAAQQNKLLLIHFWTPTCLPCKNIEKNVFPNPTVASSINDNYVALKVNAAKSQQLSSHFGVDRFPTDIISTVDGKALHRMVTDQNPMRYVRRLTTLASQHAAAAQYRPVQEQVAQAPAAKAPQRYQSAIGQQRVSATQQRAMAKRPGLDPQSRPGVGIGTNRPGNSTPQVGLTNGAVAGNITGLSTFEPPATQAAPSSNAPKYSPMISNPYAATAKPKVAAQAESLPNPAAAGLAQAQTPASTGPVSQQSTPQFQAATIAPNTLAQQAPSQPAQQQAPLQQTYNAPPANNMAATVGQPAAQMQAVPQQSQSMAASTPVNRGTLNQQAAPADDITPIQPSGNPPIGLEGRCPVWLISKGSWKKGDERWGAVHRGVTYLFSSEEAQKKFLSAPDDYSPVLAGMDVVRLASQGMVNQGTRRYGVLFDDDGEGPRRSRMFLFDSVQTRNLFEAEPDRYLQPVMQAMQSGQLDRLVR